jgi:hypothetical protein
MKLRHLMRGTEGGSQMKKSVLVWTAAELTVRAIGIGMQPLAAQELSLQRSSRSSRSTQGTDTGREWR